MVEVKLEADILKRELDSILVEIKKIDTMVLALKGAINDVIQSQK